MPLLDISGLRANVGDKEILRGIDLSVMPGEVHAVMGPNGSGKSTLAQVLAGNPAYEVTAGDVIYNGENLLELQPEERAQRGLFLAFQYPVEIPGVSNAYFLRAAYNEIRKARGEEEVDPLEFAELMDERQARGEVPLSMLLDLTLPVSIELGRTSMSVQEILQLGRGSVVQLERLAGEPVDIYVGERLFAQGEVVVLDEHFGVRITRIVSRAAVKESVA
jgi:flagellar motor switch protein FliN